MAEERPKPDGGRRELPGEAEERREGVDAIVEWARVKLENYGRTLLETGQNVEEAIDLLAVSGALSSKEIQAALREHLERLSRSGNEEDQRRLMEVCKRIVRLKDPLSRLVRSGKVAGS